VQVSSASSSSWSSLAAYKQPDAASANDSPAAIVADAAPAESTAAETVTLHGGPVAEAAAAARMPSQTGASPEVFAEIWKDGMKVGVVYADGEAVLPITPGGIGNSGGRYPYMRAEEVAQQIGGEVHYVNLPALQLAQTRAQLRAAYGV